MGRGVRGTLRRPFFHFTETEMSVLYYIQAVAPWAQEERRTYYISKVLKKDFWRVQNACQGLYRKGFLDYDAPHKCWKRQAGVDFRHISPVDASEYTGPPDSWSY